MNRRKDICGILEQTKQNIAEARDICYDKTEKNSYVMATIVYHSLPFVFSLNEPFRIGAFY